MKIIDKYCFPYFLYSPVSNSIASNISFLRVVKIHDTLCCLQPCLSPNPEILLPAYDGSEGTPSMARITILFGFVLILLGGFGYIATGSHFPTALIPSVIGVILAICGFFAHTPETKRRMLCMHIAVTVGLLGFLGTAKSIFDYFEMLGGRQFAHPSAVEEKAAMAVLLLIFVILCVRSFIAARRSRTEA